MRLNTQAVGQKIGFPRESGMLCEDIFFFRLFTTELELDSLSVVPVLFLFVYVRKYVCVCVVPFQSQQSFP